MAISAVGHSVDSRAVVSSPTTDDATTPPANGSAPAAGTPEQQNKIIKLLTGGGFTAGESKFTPKINVGKDGIGADISKKNDAGKIGGAAVDKTTSGGVSFNPCEGSGAASAGKSFGSEIKNAKGWGVSFEAGADASITAGAKTEDGTTTYSASADMSVKAKVGVSAPMASASLENTYGFKASYEVRMPEAAAKAVNPATVNPFNPSSMPTGTTATLEGSHYSSTQLNATFRHLAMQTNTTNESGVSLAVAKTGDHQVTVTVGPTEAIKAYNGIGVDVGKAATLMAGREDKLNNSTLKQATFDLSTPAGTAAFNDLLANGHLPNANAAGVSGVLTIDKVGYSSQSQLKASLGPFGTSLDGPKNTGSSETTRFPDGTAQQTTNIQYSGNVPWTTSQSFDKNGQAVAGSLTYTAKIKLDQNTRQMLEMAAHTNLPRETKEVSVTFTQDQMTKLMQQTQTAYKKLNTPMDIGSLVNDYNQKFVNNTNDFAQALTRNLGGSDYGMISRLFEISNTTHQPIDATIKPR